MELWRTSTVNQRAQNGAFPRLSGCIKIFNKTNDLSMAERVGFEPTVRLPVRRISSAVLSTTQPPLRMRMSAGRASAGSGRTRRSSSEPLRCLDRRP